MSERRQQITDEGALHKYRTEIPNTIIRGVLGRGLSLPARWLYVYLKSVAGEGGECWQNMTTLAAGSQLSRGAVSKARRELIQAKLITVMKGQGALHETDRIRILDIWRHNMTEFCEIPSSSGERDTSSLSESEESRELEERAPSLVGRVHQVNTPSSSGERASSLHERPSSSGEPKKIPMKKNPNQDPLSIVSPPDQRKEREGVRATEAIEHFETIFVEPTYADGFKALCAAYPAGRLEGMHEAWQTWSARDLEPRTDEIVAKVLRLVETTWHTREPRYIPLLKTWLDKGRYDDPLAALGVAEAAPLNKNEARTQQHLANMDRAIERTTQRERERESTVLPSTRVIGRDV